MTNRLPRFTFFLELSINGAFILTYSLNKYSKFLPTFNRDLTDNFLYWLSTLIPIIIFISIIFNYLSVANLETFFRKHVFSIIVFISLILTWGDLEFFFWLSSVHLLSSVLILYEDNEDNGDNKKKKKIIFDTKLFFNKIKPPQIVIITFAALIILGTTLLMVPITPVSGKSLSLVDAIFMATSATCVTGLSTVNLSSDFTIFGQIVILVLIQIGGLGIMILYSSMTIFLGHSMPMKERVIMQGVLDVSNFEDLLEVIVDIIKYTFIIELWGSIILTIAFGLEGLPFSEAIYYGVFHSISSFCNAGLTLFSNSLEDFATRPLINGTICILISLGGLGFIVMKELSLAISHRKKFIRWSLHTKIVLTTTAILIFVSFFIIFFGEFLYSFDQFTLFEKIQISLFQAITIRTAGFNTIPLGSLNNYTIYFMSLMMFIGAAPGSTGGGIKVTTLAILISSIRSTLNRKDSVEIFDRTIPSSLVVKATALFIVSLMITAVFIFILMKVDPKQPFLNLFFEVISASGTVGLSMGTTSSLSVLGKWAIIFLMFIGRVGPLTFVLALGRPKESGSKVALPLGRVMIG